MKIINIACMIILLLFISGCSYRLNVKDPFYINEQYKPKYSQEVLLFKTVNLGVDPDLDTDLDISRPIKTELEARGYKFIDGNKKNIPIEFTSSMLNDLDFSSIEKLNLKPKSWVMVIAVESLKRAPYALGVRADATLTGYLVEYPTGKVIWEGVGFGYLALGWLMAAAVDDDALFLASRDLMYSFPINRAAIDPSTANIHGVKDFNKFTKIVGGCPNGMCDQSDKKSHICVIMDKSIASSDMEADADDEIDDTKNIYPIYDATELIGQAGSGEYVCWEKTPGKTIIHLNMYRPAYFRSEPGKYYYLNVKYKSTSIWSYEEIPLSKAKSVLSTYKRINMISAE